MSFCTVLLARAFFWHKTACLCRPSVALCLILLGAALCCSGPVLAATTQESPQARYEHCLNLAASNPAAALGVAGEWIKDKGGAAAEHCSAVALVGLKRYPEAGARLDALAAAPGVGGNLRASLFDQAGNAWLLAGDAAHAVTSFQAALALSASDPDLYADLARAEAMRMDWAMSKPISMPPCRCRPNAPIFWCCGPARGMRWAIWWRRAPTSIGRCY